MTTEGGGGGLGTGESDVFTVSEGIGLQRLACHAPINIIGGSVAVDGGGGVAPAPDGNQHLRDIVTAGVEVSHAVPIDHINIAGFVRAEHQVGRGGVTPGIR